MSFWKDITGNAKDSSVPDLTTIIPDNTLVLAVIKKIYHKTTEEKNSLVELLNEPLIIVEWKVVDGEFKNKFLSQKVEINATKEEKVLRARNNLMRLYALQHIDVPKDYPSIEELELLTGEVYEILIKVWEINDKTGNWVSFINSAA